MEISFHVIQSTTDEDKYCLADFLLADPRNEKLRIERTKGGLLIDSFRWILDNAEFQRSGGVRAITPTCFG